MSRKRWSYRLSRPIPVNRTVLLATGLVDESPDIEGLESGVYGGAVRYCPICDGFEAMDRRIGMFGSGEEAGGKAHFLRTYSRDVMMFENGPEPISGRSAAKQVRIFFINLKTARAPNLTIPDKLLAIADEVIE